mmetsp:Transcript_148644/g.477270  ORF Transcript_148644/g.477270 Transcript_148644/m.477270 type:complete len:622 (+) Transcript_148644:64-1929(+)
MLLNRALARRGGHLARRSAAMAIRPLGLRSAAARQYAAAAGRPLLIGRGGLRAAGRRLEANMSTARVVVLRRFAASAGAAAERASGGSFGRGLLAVTVGTLGAGGVYGYWHSWRMDEALREEEEVELALVPEPSVFVHPYEVWPWYRKAWFAMRRSLYLAWVFAPFVAASTCLMIFSDKPAWRELWLAQMLNCTQNAGAAFQKFGQWLSMRPDMFPPDVIETLSKLRSDAPSHPTSVTRETLRLQFGRDVAEMFESFEDEPVASGSVGQVHRARLRPEFALDGPGGKLRDVAVKVQHPGVVDSAFMDLDIVWKVVDFSQHFLHMTLPFNRGEFDVVIQAQMDFTREAFNLQQFSKNFKHERRIRFPKVSHHFVTPTVLVETWADGQVISNILEDFDNTKSNILEDFDSAKTTCKEAVTRCEDAVDEALAALAKTKREVQGRLCSILYDMSMKMMVRDNFVHGDLHGGNILYSEGDNHVTVLDAGIATSLDRQTFKPFGKFLHALCSGNTDTIVEYLQKFNESKLVVNIDEFKQDIQAIMDKFMGPLRINPDMPVNAADMFGEVMFSMQRHKMLLKGDVASTLFTISISEGLIRQLDPTFDVATSALPYVVRFMPSLFTAGD